MPEATQSQNQDFSSVPNSQAHDQAVHGKRLAFIFLGLLLAMFVSSLSETIAATALPTIVGDLGGVEIMQWVSTAYILSSTITMPIYGKIGDIIGRKYLLVFALGVYATGKIVCGLSVNMTMLLTGRFISGLGGGGLIILSQAAIADVVPPRKRGVYLGVMGSVFTVSTVLGPLLGGWFVQVAGWRWIFWFTVPMAVLAMIGLAIFLTDDKKGARITEFDWRGSICMAIGVVTLVLATIWGGGVYPWISWQILGLFAIAAIAFTFFAFVERKAKEPIIPMRFFHNSNFDLCAMVSLLINVTLMGAITYLPTFFQIVDRMSPELAGIVCTPMSIGSFITSTGTGWLAAKTGKYKWMPIAMAAVCALGFFCLSTMRVSTPLIFVLIFLFLLGFGFGLGTEIMVLIVQNEFSHEVVGTATAANNFFRQIGSTIGASLIGTMFTSRLAADLAGKLPKTDNITLSSLTPSVVDKLPSSVQDAIATGYTDALVPLFQYFVPIMILCFVLMFFIKQHPLAKKIDHGASK